MANQWYERGVHDPSGHLVFACRDTLFALPAGAAAEIVNLPTLTPVPGAPRHVLGVFSLRAELVAVIDLLRLQGREASGWTRAVLVRVPEGVVAFAVTRVQGVMSLEGSFNPVGSAGFDAHLRGPLTCEDGGVFALDPRGLVEFLAGFSAL